MNVKNDYYKVKLYQFYCDHCNYKHITDGSDISNLKEVKTSPVPGGIPKKDPKTGKIVTGKLYKQKRKFKCPGCGRVISPRLLGVNKHPMEETKESSESQEEIIENIIKELGKYGEDNAFGY